MGQVREAQELQRAIILFTFFFLTVAMVTNLTVVTKCLTGAT